jgi:ferrous iron transport protein A
MTPGTPIDCLFAGLAPEPMAYRIRGAVIALRREQAAEIIVERKSDRTAERGVPAGTEKPPS